MMRKHGCTREVALRMFIMPDPSLPPEQQLEIVTGGKLVQPTDGASNANVIPGGGSPRDAGPSPLYSPKVQREFSVLSLS